MVWENSDHIQRKGGSKGTSIRFVYYPLGSRMFSEAYHLNVMNYSRRYDNRNPEPRPDRSLTAEERQAIFMGWVERKQEFIRESLLANKTFQKELSIYTEAAAELVEQAKALPEYEWLKWHNYRNKWHYTYLGMKDTQIILTVFDQREFDRLLKEVGGGEVDWRPTETLPEDYYAL